MTKRRTTWALILAFIVVLMIGAWRNARHGKETFGVAAMIAHEPGRRRLPRMPFTLPLGARYATGRHVLDPSTRTLASKEQYERHERVRPRAERGTEHPAPSPRGADRRG